MKTSATIEGFDNLLKAMNELSEEITKGKTARIWKNSLRYAMEPVADSVKQSLIAKSYDTGQLANSVYVAVHKPQSRDKQSLSYMGETYMARVSIKSEREGAEKRTMTYQTKKGKTISRTYTAFKGSNRPVAMALEFGTAKMAPEPFLRSSLESNIQKVQERLGRYLWNELTFGKYAKEAGIDFTGRI